MEAEYNKRLDDQWTRHFSGRQDVLLPHYFCKLAQNSLMFVGFNPSFSEKRCVGGLPSRVSK